MKKNTHPPYQEVLFVDSSTNVEYLIGSTIQTKEKGTHQGKEYPKVRVPISSSSHPFFTKSNQFIDTEGRVDKFTKKYQRQSEQEKKTQEKQDVAQKEKVKATKSAKKK